jgi:CspA family cold shock protein
MKMAYARDRAVECQELAADKWREQVMTGTIKKIMRQKGFGFITPDDGSEDVFFHRGSLAPRNQIEDLNEGDSVQFQVRKGEKGPVALDLKIR